MNTSVYSEDFFSTLGEVFVYMAYNAKSNIDYRRLFFDAIKHFNVSKKYQDAMVEILTPVLSLQLR